jgi:hypothetical protein
VIFALNTRGNTEDGDTYTLGEYTRWLVEAGFTRVQTADIASHPLLIVAVKG